MVIINDYIKYTDDSTLTSPPPPLQKRLGTYKTLHNIHAVRTQLVFTPDSNHKNGFVEHKKITST